MTSIERQGLTIIGPIPMPGFREWFTPARRRGSGRVRRSRPVHCSRTARQCGAATARTASASAAQARRDSCCAMSTLA